MCLKHAAMVLACLSFLGLPLTADGQPGQPRAGERGRDNVEKSQEGVARSRKKMPWVATEASKQRPGRQDGQPPGWSHGNKTGWDGGDQPPGLDGKRGVAEEPVQTTWVRRQTTRFRDFFERTRDRVRDVF